MPPVPPSIIAPAEVLAFRRRRRWTQEALSQALGVSKRAVEEWEAGRKPPPPYLRLALAALQAGAGGWSADPVEVFAAGDGFDLRYAPQPGAAGPPVVHRAFPTCELAERYGRFWTGVAPG